MQDKTLPEIPQSPSAGSQKLPPNEIRKKKAREEYERRVKEWDPNWDPYPRQLKEAILKNKAREQSQATPEVTGQDISRNPNPTLATESTLSVDNEVKNSFNVHSGPSSVLGTATYYPPATQVCAVAHQPVHRCGITQNAVTSGQTAYIPPATQVFISPDHPAYRTASTQTLVGSGQTTNVPPATPVSVGTNERYRNASTQTSVILGQATYSAPTTQVSVSSHQPVYRDADTEASDVSGHAEYKDSSTQTENVPDDSISADVIPAEQVNASSETESRSRPDVPPIWRPTVASKARERKKHQ